MKNEKKPISINGNNNDDIEKCKKEIYKILIETGLANKIIKSIKEFIEEVKENEKKEQNNTSDYISDIDIIDYGNYDICRLISTE